MAGGDLVRWDPVLEKLLADLKALHAYLRGEISHEDYCKQVGVLPHDFRVPTTQPYKRAAGHCF
jgi:hypothetical protein